MSANQNVVNWANGILTVLTVLVCAAFFAGALGAIDSKRNPASATPASTALVGSIRGTLPATGASGSLGETSPLVNEQGGSGGSIND